MMRRLVIITLVVLLCPACKRAGQFPPAEVLQRATMQSVQMASARFTATVGFRIAKGALQADVKATFDGRLADGGQNMATAVQADGTVLGGGSRSTFRVSGDVMTDMRKEAYFLLKELFLDPLPPWAASVEKLKGQWWKLPGGSPTVATVTPDPHFLRMQSEVVTVTKDHGLVRLHDRDVYRYDVTIDPEKLIAFLKASALERSETFDEEATRSDVLRYRVEGELWIDAETFSLHRLRWMIVTNEDPDGLRFSIDAELFDHGKALQIAPPAQFKMFDSTNFLPAAQASS